MKIWKCKHLKIWFFTIWKFENVDVVKHEVATIRAENDLKHVDAAVHSKSLDGIRHRLEIFDTVREHKHVGAAVHSKSFDGIRQRHEIFDTVRELKQVGAVHSKPMCLTSVRTMPNPCLSSEKIPSTTMMKNVAQRPINAITAEM